MNNTDQAFYRLALQITIGLAFIILSIMAYYIGLSQARKKLAEKLSESGHELIEAHSVFFDLRYMFRVTRYQMLLQFTAARPGGPKVTGYAVVTNFLGLGGARIDWDQPVY